MKPETNKRSANRLSTVRNIGTFGLGVLVFVVLLSSPSTAGAQDQGWGYSKPEDHATVGRAGMIAGTTFEILGLIGSGVGAAIMRIATLYPEAGYPVMLASGGVFLAGNAVSTTSYSIRHGAYLDADRSPKLHMLVTSWLFTAGTAGLYAGAVTENVKQEHRFDRYMGTVLYFSLAMLTEVLDLALFRPLWLRALRRSDPRDGPKISVVPILSPAGSSGVRSRILGFAACASF